MIQADMLTGIIKAWKLIMRLRLTSQYGSLLSGIEPDNLLDPILISEEVKHLLDQAINQIDTLMLMAAIDFHAQEP